MKSVKSEYVYLGIITIFGGILRFYGLGDKPLWTDEVLFGFYVKETFSQEFTTVLIGKLFGLHSEFGLRSISAITGTLTIPAIYFVLKDKKTALYVSLFVAVCPLFVFWSRMARPYAFTGLFVVLGWRYAWCYIIAIATTPIALIGVRVVEQKRYVLLVALLSAIFFYLIREDANRNWTIQQILNSSRWFYIPLLTAVIQDFTMFRIKYLFLQFFNKNIVQKIGLIELVIENIRSSFLYSENSIDDSTRIGLSPLLIAFIANS